MWGDAILIGPVVSVLHVRSSPDIALRILHGCSGPSGDFVGREGWRRNHMPLAGAFSPLFAGRVIGGFGKLNCHVECFRS